MNIAIEQEFIKRYIDKGYQERLLLELSAWQSTLNVYPPKLVLHSVCFSAVSSVLSLADAVGVSVCASISSSEMLHAPAISEL